MEWIELGELIYKPISGEWGKEIVGDKDENSVKVLRTTNFTNEGLLDYSDVVLRNINTEKVEIKKLNYGDIIVEKSGGTDNFPVGRVVYFDKVKEIYLCNNFTTIFRTKREGIKNKYLFYFLFYNYNKGGMIKYYNKTTGIQNLKVNFFIKDLKVPVPPMETQEKIVQILDQAQALIDKRKEQIQALDQLIDSIFYTMFGDPVSNEKGWEVKELGELSSLVTKGSSPNWQGIEYVTDDSQVLFVTSENVREGYLDLSKRKYLQNEFNEKQKRSILKKGDFLINIVGASIGRACMFDIETKANINQAVSLVRLKNECINEKYLLFFLNSKSALLQYDNMKVSVARANLSLQNIKDLEILNPPIQFQNQFAEKVQVIEKQKEVLEESLKLLEENYKSIMDKAFKGQLFN